MLLWKQHGSILPSRYSTQHSGRAQMCSEFSKLFDITITHMRSNVYVHSTFIHLAITSLCLNCMIFARHCCPTHANHQTILLPPKTTKTAFGMLSAPKRVHLNTVTCMPVPYWNITVARHPPYFCTLHALQCRFKCSSKQCRRFQTGKVILVVRQKQPITSVSLLQFIYTPGGSKYQRNVPVPPELLDNPYAHHHWETPRRFVRCQWAVPGLATRVDLLRLLISCRHDRCNGLCNIFFRICLESFVRVILKSGQQSYRGDRKTLAYMKPHTFLEYGDVFAANA